MSGVECLYVIVLAGVLTASHAISAIQTFVTVAAKDGDMAAGIAGGCICIGFK